MLEETYEVFAEYATLVEKWFGVASERTDDTESVSLEIGILLLEPGFRKQIDASVKAFPSMFRVDRTYATLSSSPFTSSETCA